MRSWGFAFTSQWGYRERGNFVVIGWSRHHRAHHPGLTDDELDDLWNLGEDIARGCIGYVKLDGPNQYGETTCVYCANLASCTGDRREVRPDLFKLIKLCYSHDAT